MVGGEKDIQAGTLFFHNKFKVKVNTTIPLRMVPNRLSKTYTIYRHCPLIDCST